MKKHFKSKRNKKRYFIWYILLILAILFMDNVYMSYATPNTIINNDFKDLFRIKLNPEKILLFLGLNHHADTKVKIPDKEEIPVFKEYNYLNPTIYVYNTHQTEEYSDGDIYEASKYLKEQLESYNIDMILEDTNIAAELKKNNYAYKDSYKITRELLLKNINDNVHLYIDLHRDSSSYQSSTVEIDNKKYAKILFVIGGKHETFDDNYLIAERLNKLLKNNSNKISRGIFVRKSSSYNQDLNSNVILIEVGGPHNSMEEVKNSINVLAEAIAQFIGE